MRSICVIVLSGIVFSGFAQGIVIDHTCADLEQIPAVWITAVKNTIQSHYAHTSHGGQLTYGVGFIESANLFYDCEVGYLTLPTTSGAYCVFNGQENGAYVGPESYWQTTAGLNLTRDVLNNNPTIDTSMWCWCGQCSYYTAAQVQEYLDAMTLLEGEYPGITFIYFTGNAQSEGSSGYNRYQRNNQIRAYCAANNKVLFDFADLDCWWYNASTTQWEHNTYSYSGTDIPSEHPHYNGNEYAHTTAESCTVKGRAWWWMMSVLAGWSSTSVSQGNSAGFETGYSVSVVNPVTIPFEVTVTLPTECRLSMDVYDTAGRRTASVANGLFEPGEHTFQVNRLRTGVYFIGVDNGMSFSTCRTVVIN
jgi:hypothetical protein